MVKGPWSMVRWSRGNGQWFMVDGGRGWGDTGRFRRGAGAALHMGVYLCSSAVKTRLSRSFALPCFPSVLSVGHLWNLCSPDTGCWMVSYPRFFSVLNPNPKREIPPAKRLSRPDGSGTA